MLLFVWRMCVFPGVPCFLDKISEGRLKHLYLVLFSLVFPQLFLVIFL